MILYNLCCFFIDSLLLSCSRNPVPGSSVWIRGQVLFSSVGCNCLLWFPGFLYQRQTQFIWLAVQRQHSIHCHEFCNRRHCFRQSNNRGQGECNPRTENPFATTTGKGWTPRRNESPQRKERNRHNLWRKQHSGEKDFSLETSWLRSGFNWILQRLFRSFFQGRPLYFLADTRTPRLCLG